MSRLNEALLVAYGAMGEMNLKAVDRVVRIVRALDRYAAVLAARPLTRTPALDRDAEAAAPPRCPTTATGAQTWLKPLKRLIPGASPGWP